MRDLRWEERGNKVGCGTREVRNALYRCQNKAKKRDKKRSEGDANEWISPERSNIKSSMEQE